MPLFRGVIPQANSHLDKQQLPFLDLPHWWSVALSLAAVVFVALPHLQTSRWQYQQNVGDGDFRHLAHAIRVDSRIGLNLTSRLGMGLLRHKRYRFATARPCLHELLWFNRLLQLQLSIVLPFDQNLQIIAAF